MRGLGAILARLRTGSCIGNGGQRDTPIPVAMPSLLPTSSRDHLRAGLGSVTLNRLYFVGYVTVKQQPLQLGPANRVDGAFRELRLESV